MKVLTFVFGVLLFAFSYSVIAGENGEKLYRVYCAQCHGILGNGAGINARDMSVQPRDHTDAKFISGKSDDDLTKVIKEGGQSVNKSVLMPPWADVLTDQDVSELVKYLRVLCKCGS